MKKKKLREAIAIDFDGCLCEDKYPDIGQPNWAVIDAAKERQQEGAGLILWTCREGKALKAAVAAAKRWGLKFDAVNENLPAWKKYYGNNPRKVGATEYWDDRSVGINSDGKPVSLFPALSHPSEDADSQNVKYEVHYEVSSTYIAEVRAENVEDALQRADLEFQNANFGALTEVEGGPFLVVGDYGEIAWNKYDQ